MFISFYFLVRKRMENTSKTIQFMADFYFQVLDFSNFWGMPFLLVVANQTASMKFFLMPFTTS